MNPEEVEFIATDSTVYIIPNFNSEVIHLISGDIGPIRSSLPVSVPIWLAVNLKQQQKCRIQPPEWMDVEYLEDIKETEKRSQFFTKMPSEHYMIETKVLMNAAAEDIPNSDEIRTIIKDIWDMRMSKLRKSIDIFIKGDVSYAHLNNLTLMELNSVRPLLPHALDQLTRLKSQPGGSHSQTNIFSNTTFNSE